MTAVDAPRRSAQLSGQLVSSNSDSNPNLNINSTLEVGFIMTLG
ncbi:hypothetical protein DSBG_1535 [Desulfosporosinus sp. BG]|nr:hypothetical protein DSBG_1535 [Desulfosporosinus sp. BG]